MSMARALPCREERPVPCFARRSLAKSGYLISREWRKISRWNLHRTILYRLSCLFIWPWARSPWQFSHKTHSEVRAPATRRMRLTENRPTVFFNFSSNNSWQTRDVTAHIYPGYFIKTGAGLCYSQFATRSNLLQNLLLTSADSPHCNNKVHSYFIITFILYHYFVLIRGNLRPLISSKNHFTKAINVNHKCKFGKFSPHILLWTTQIMNHKSRITNRKSRIRCEYTHNLTPA